MFDRTFVLIEGQPRFKPGQTAFGVASERAIDPQLNFPSREFRSGT